LRFYRPCRSQKGPNSVFQLASIPCSGISVNLVRHFIIALTLGYARIKFPRRCCFLFQPPPIPVILRGCDFFEKSRFFRVQVLYFQHRFLQKIKKVTASERSASRNFLSPILFSAESKDRSPPAPPYCYKAFSRKRTGPERLDAAWSLQASSRSFDCALTPPPHRAQNPRSLGTPDLRRSCWLRMTERKCVAHENRIQLSSDAPMT
jgi:hypothetical protein